MFSRMFGIIRRALDGCMLHHYDLMAAGERQNENRHMTKGEVNNGTTCIYNQDAVEFTQCVAAVAAA